MSARDGVSEYLLVAVDESWYALAAGRVESAVATRDVTPLPFVPACVEGLVNINDRVMPLLDLRALLMPGVVRAGQSEWVVVETSRSPCALRVDRVVGSVSAAAGESGVPPEEHKGLSESPANAGASAALVCGRFVQDGRTVLVLDCDVLGNLVAAEDVSTGRRGLLGRLAHEGVVSVERSDACIVALCGSEIYGVALADAVEILDTQPCAAMPGAPAFVEGLALVRGEPLLVLALAGLLGRPVARPLRNVIVIESGGDRYGLAVDRVEGILAYEYDRFRPIDEDGAELDGVVVDGDRAIGMLGVARVLRDARRRQLAPFMPSRRAGQQAAVEERMTLLEVDIAGETLGVPLSSVRRITAYSAGMDLEGEGNTRLHGAVNIDGNVLPVLDLGEALGIAGATSPDGRLPGARAAWVVVGGEGHEWAIAVSRARNIVSVPVSAVESIGGGAGGLVNAVARVDTHLVSLLDITSLLEAA